MPRLKRLAAGAGLTAALLAGPVSPAAADVSVRFSSGGLNVGSGHYGKGHGFGGRRHVGRQQSFGNRSYGGSSRGGQGHRFETRPRAGRHQGHRGYGGGHSGGGYRGLPHDGRRTLPYGGDSARHGYSPTRRHDSWSRYPYADIRGSARKEHRGITPREGTVGSGCGPVSRRSYDRYGRAVITKRTVCHDRYGRPYIVGDGYR